MREKIDKKELIEYNKNKEIGKAMMQADLMNRSFEINMMKHSRDAV